MTLLFLTIRDCVDLEAGNINDILLADEHQCRRYFFEIFSIQPLHTSASCSGIIKPREDAVVIFGFRCLSNVIRLWLDVAQDFLDTIIVYFYWACLDSIRVPLSFLVFSRLVSSKQLWRFIHNTETWNLNDAARRHLNGNLRIFWGHLSVSHGSIASQTKSSIKGCNWYLFQSPCVNGDWCCCVRSSEPKLTLLERSSRPYCLRCRVSLDANKGAADNLLTSCSRKP